MQSDVKKGPVHFPRHADEVRLSRRVTVGDYLEMARRRDRKAIARFLHSRFTERYLSAIPTEKQVTRYKAATTGFYTMAICCLMIEAIASFREGWADTTEQRHGKPFVVFFDHYRHLFGLDDADAKTFYQVVRNGLLHQAETKNGWKIWRVGPLFDTRNRTINARLFAEKMSASLDCYRDELVADANFGVGLWKNLTDKMSNVCANALGDPA